MKDLITDIDIYELPSRDALLEVLSRGDVATKEPHSPGDGPEVDMFIDLGDIDYASDPVLSIDFQQIDETSLIEDEDYTLYHALGYDELIPNRTLARLINDQIKAVSLYKD